MVLDDDNEKIGYKIREAQQVDRVPYMLVLGAKEAEAGNISVRDRKGETTTMELDAFIAKVTGRDQEPRLRQASQQLTKATVHIRRSPFFMPK